LQLHAPRGGGEARAGGRGVQGAILARDGDASELGAPAGILHGRLDRPDQRADWGSRIRRAPVHAAGPGHRRPEAVRPPGEARDAGVRVTGLPGGHALIKAVIFDIGGILERPFDDVLFPEMSRMLGVPEPRLRQRRADDAVPLTEGRMTLREFYARLSDVD